MKMTRTIGMFVILAVFGMACDDDTTYTTYTGDIVVISDGVTTVNGTPVDDLLVGVFDMNVLVTTRYFLDEAIVTSQFKGGKIKFENLNMGNYVVVVLDQAGFRQTVQVKAGKTITVNIFD